MAKTKKKWRSLSFSLEWTNLMFPVSRSEKKMNEYFFLGTIDSYKRQKSSLIKFLVLRIIEEKRR